MFISYPSLYVQIIKHTYVTPSVRTTKGQDNITQVVICVHGSHIRFNEDAKISKLQTESRAMTGEHNLSVELCYEPHV